MDYRRTKYCPELVDIKEKKKKIEALIKKEHPHAQDMHTYISDNSEKYKLKFVQAYNGKCAYCGVSIDLIKKNEFEIDHFLYEKFPKFKTKKEAGYIENLILACHDCNHNKSDFWINEPTWVQISGDIDTFTNMIWNNLNEDNKVSLFVRFIDIETGKYETRIINKNK